MTDRGRRVLRFGGLTLIGPVILAGLFWTNLNFINNNPGGNDFLPRWVAAREFFNNGSSPYSPETTLAIQEQLYGRPAEAGEDLALFAYPFYTLYVIYPLAGLVSFGLARAVWTTLSQLAIVLTAFIAIKIAGWKPARAPLAGFLVLALLWYHGAKPLVDGTPAVLVALFVALALWAIKNSRDAWAGIFLALATIKPQMVFWLIPLTLLWALTNNRRSLISSFALSMLVLLIPSFVIQPNWLIENWAQVSLYPSYAPPGNLAGIVENWWGPLSSNWAWGLTGLIILLVLREWWQALGAPFQRYLWAAFLTLAAAPFLAIPTTTSNYIVLLPIFPFIFEAWSRRQEQESPRFELAFMALTLILPWLLFTATLLPREQFREHLVMLFPVPLILMIALYWLKWGLVQHEAPSYPAQRLQKGKRP